MRRILSDARRINNAVVSRSFMRSMPTYVIKYIKHNEVIFEHIFEQSA